MKTNFNLIIKFIQVSVAWITLSFKLSDIGPASVYTQILDRFLLLIKTRGIGGALTYWKSARTCWYMFLSGSNEPRPPGIGLTPEGIPRILGKRLVRKIRTDLSPDICR
jgi:hypothetical protein